MEYRQLGSTGVRVSAVGLGTNQLGRTVDQETTNEIVAQALDAGINFIDTANVYGGGQSETYLGNAIKNHRSEIILATKAGMRTGDGPNDGGTSRRHLMQQVDISLQRLQTDYIDLYQMHRWDPNTPADETLRSLEDLVRTCKVRYIGASNYSAWQLVRSHTLAEQRGAPSFVTVQPHYNMLRRDVEEELIPACQRYGIGIIPYFPLAAGVLTGKYRPGQPPPPDSRGALGRLRRFDGFLEEPHIYRIERLRRWAEERGHSLAELAVAWLLVQPQVCTVITGVRTPEQVCLNAAAAGWTLTDDEEQEAREILETDPAELQPH